MMTEEKRELIDFINQEIDKWDDERRYVRVLEIALAALTQPASPALKLPDAQEQVIGVWNPSANEIAVRKLSGIKIVDFAHWHCHCTKEVVVRDISDHPAILNAPHSAPIEPICATGGAEWVSNERVEEIIYRAEMFGHGAGYLPEEVIPMAKELLALRKAFSEPYGYVHQGVYEAGFSSGLSADHEAYKNSSTHIPLYRKP